MSAAAARLGLVAGRDRPIGSALGDGVILVTTLRFARAAGGLTVAAREAPAILAREGVSAVVATTRGCSISAAFTRIADCATGLPETNAF